MLQRTLVAAALWLLISSTSAAQSPTLIGLPQASDPTCNAGEYKLAVKSGTAKWRKCENGVWSDMGLASGTGDDLGSHIATTTLNLSNNALTNIGDASFEGQVTQYPTVLTTTALSPTHIKSYDLKNWFNIDGEKWPVEGDCIDLWSGSGTPQAATGAPDGLCDLNRYPVGAIRKTKSVGHEQEFVNLSESEGYAHWIKMFGGGDTDLVGINIDAYATGGAHALGDEGASLYRGFVQDYYLTVVRTIGANLSAGAGTQTVTVGSLSEDESQMVGEGKLAVFTGSNVAVSVIDAPPGTINAGVLEDSGTSWSLTGGATGQGVWTLGTGQVTSSGVKANSWCFSPVDSDYTDVNGVASQIWLMISAIDSGTDKITTRWENQGYNAKTPYPLLSGEDASSATTNEGIVAPCAVLGPPTFAGGIGDYVADSLTFVKGADFPAQSSGNTFKVSAYPTLRLDGVRINAANKLGGMYSHDGLTWNNLLNNENNSGRFMLGAAVRAGYSGALSNLKDGQHHAMEYGLDCDTSPGACKYGLGFRYSPDDSDVGFDMGTAIKITFGTDDWDDDIDRAVIAPYSTSAHITAKDLTLDKTDGWGEDGIPFAKRFGSVTTGNCAEWDASGRLIDSGGTCGGGGGGGSGDITDVGPGFGTGGAFLDGTASTGTDMLVWEGTTIDGFELRLSSPTSDPVADVNLTIPSATSTLATLALAETFTNKTLTSPTITSPVLSLTQSAAPTPTVEGRAEWETDDDHLIVGDGSAQVEFVPAEDVSGDATMTDAGAVSLATNTVNANELVSTAVTPGSYQNPTVTIDEDGRITSATAGISASAPGAGDQVLVSDSTSAGTYRSIPDSDGSTQKLQYDVTTNTFSAGTDDDVPESGDFGNAVDIDSTGAVRSNAVALVTDTTGNFVGTVTGDAEIVVAGADAENATKTLSIASTITRDSELSAYTSGTATPVDGTTACNTRDQYLETDAFKLYVCTDGATDKWYGVQLVDTP